MGVNVPNGLTEPFPGVTVVDIGHGLSPSEYDEFCSSLAIPAHYSIGGNFVPQRSARVLQVATVLIRDGIGGVEDWSYDRYWHADQPYEGLEPFETALYARTLKGGEVASTSVIDTALLLESIESDNPGFTEEVRHSIGTFSIKKYFRQLITGDASTEYLEEMLTEEGLKSLRHLESRYSPLYPDLEYPALVHHPFRDSSCTTIDELRIMRLSNMLGQRGRQIIDLVRNNYLNLKPEELAGRPYYYEHRWEEGQVLIFPKFGTIHRAEQSPVDEERREVLKTLLN